MDAEKAIDLLKWRSQVADARVLDTACNMAITALRKQIPVRPMSDYIGGGVRHFACGSCGADLTGRDKFCHECGKAVRWE